MIKFTKDGAVKHQDTDVNKEALLAEGWKVEEKKKPAKKKAE